MEHAGHDTHIADAEMLATITNDMGEGEDGRLIVRTLVYTGPQKSRPPAMVLVGLVDVAEFLKYAESVQVQLSVQQARALRDMLGRAITQAEEAPARLEIVK